MKRRFQLGFILILLFAGSRAFALERGDVVGSYELTGVMEMAGGLRLKADQKYLAGFFYGAATWIEEGSWKIEGSEVVLSGGHFKQRNDDKLALFLPAGIRLRYEEGKLSGSGSEGKLNFIDPNKTPTGKGKEAGEGRMRVKGKLVKWDADSLVVDMGECLTFDASRLSEPVRKAVRGKPGRQVDVEIPYSAMLGSSSCP